MWSGIAVNVFHGINSTLPIAVDAGPFRGPDVRVASSATRPSFPIDFPDLPVRLTVPLTRTCRSDFTIC